MTDTPRIQYVTSADGVSIAHTSMGDGFPVVLTANAWGDINIHSSGVMSNIVAGVTQAGRRVVFYDGRGSGDSDRGVQDISLEARLSDLEAVVDAQGLERFDLFGTIHGAAAAVAYAARYPNRVSRLVLFQPYANGRTFYSATPMMRAIRALSDLAEVDWEFFTLTLASWITRFSDATQTRKIASMYQKGMEPRDYLASVEAFEATDITGLLPLVKVPTLVVRDDSSLFSTVPRIARQVAAAIPSAEFATLDNMSQYPAVIAQFLGMEPPPGTGQSAGFHTVLFTDVEGSTALTDRLGDAAARELLREHERITREQLRAHGGSEVKTMGDGFMASFGSATRALECAIAIQKAFTDSEPTVGAKGPSPLRPDHGIKVRCGLNAGEPIAEDDPDGRSDLFGTAVIVAARIAAQAHGGEILVSDVVRQLVAGKRFLFNDRGEHALKGFEDPVRVFEVSWREA
jgi:class 3 adenylate cyclase/pimeloyl-ACP methyl ester carboxylesterase